MAQGISFTQHAGGWWADGMFGLLPCNMLCESGAWCVGVSAVRISRKAWSP
jgi:hypothetical protein